MKNSILASVAVAVLVLLSLPITGRATSPVVVDVLFMNHGPLRPTVERLKQVLSGYGDKVNSSWHDFESKEGEKFMAEKGLKQHVPLVIWVNGKSAISVEGKDVQLMGFPSGSGPAAFQGKWTMDDLRKALDQLTGQK
jgi:hypothetical protein